MKLPSDVQFHPDLHLLIWRPRGVLNENAVNRITSFIAEHEASSDENELRFVDSSGLSVVALNFSYVFHVALYRRLSRSGQPPIKCACFVRNPAFAHYFKLHGLLTDHSPLQVRIFEKIRDAAKWLNIPEELLKA